MRIGVMIGGRLDLDGLVARTQELEAQGYDSVWMPNVFGLDAMGAFTVIGRETERIELGTAVVPTYPRHPVTMAQQALTVQAASGNRFALGIGLSHKFVIEDMWGMSFERPARHMRDYLEALLPLLRGGEVNVENDSYRIHATYGVAGAEPPQVLLAAMAPRMLALAGSVADGTSLWMTGPDTIETYIAPALQEAAERAGREQAPRIVAAFPIAVTNNPDDARERVGKMLANYSPIPSYRAMLDREGAAGPEDVAILGDERVLDEALDRLEAMGVSDFSASIMPVDPEAEGRTAAYLIGRMGR
ncbi:MAG: TIGR03564 family F420-dependent LLM class oxidoreductase [Dehalococcoidia bacterium]|nr:TIGR03564 family F420-dependent LLM class oxidoreductase [Dehalococcoidia bacterium]MYA52897.1 TIGR03564 family F420-dependent LLM class oxidoreductase [Dehalococcoidia bacterium]